MLTIDTLGRLVIKQDDEVLSGFVSQKTVALFVYLVAHPGIHQRDVLAELFWSDTTGKQALKNLRTVLSSLQKQLGDYLDVTRQTLEVINRDDIILDIEAFDTRLDMIAERSKYPYSPRQHITALSQTVDLYQGEFLVGLKTENAPELDTWIMLERERLHGRVVAALTQLLQVALDNGYYEQGINYGRRLLTLEPWLEDACQLMMRLYAYSGNRNAALQQYQSFAKLLLDELDVEPEDDTQLLYKHIKMGRVSTTPFERPSNLPPPTMHYIEDNSLVTQAHTLLDTPTCRLVTLLGPGGIGKTQFSQHIAHQRLEDYRDGVFYVPMAALTSVDFLPQAILTALDIPQLDATRSAENVLLEKLHDRHLLLVLDNFEHLLSAAGLVAKIVTHAPYVQVIVTSREQLSVEHEHILSLHGLPYTVNGDKHPAALKLFEVNAKQQRPDFDLDAHREPVERICRLVAGMPLGIVIAAGWLNTLTVEDVANRISDSLDFLTHHRRDLPERHRGITALLDSTWESLPPIERLTLMMLSVFPADFDTEAALAVTGAAVEDLRRLVAKSLLQTDGSGRYLLHELLRRYTRDKLEDADMLNETRYAHFHHYHAWVSRQLTRSLPLHRQFEEIDREFHNLWHFDWLPLDEQRRYILHLAQLLPEYWIARGNFIEEGVELIEQGLLEQDVDRALRTNAIILSSKMRFNMGQTDDELIKLLQEALQTSRDLQDLPLEGMALNCLECILAARGEFEQARAHLLEMVRLYENAPEAVKSDWRVTRIISRAYTNLGVTSLQVGDFDQARHYAAQGMAVNTGEGDDVGLAVGHNTFGIIALEHDDLDDAHHHFSEALKLAHKNEHTRHITIFSGNLGEVMHKQGQLAEARQLYHETLEAAHAIGNRKTMLNILEQLVDVALDSGKPKRAATLYGAALCLRESTGIAIQPREMASQEARVQRLKDAVNDATVFDSCITDGQRMSLAEVVAYV